MDVLAPPATGNQIDALGRAPDEDDVVGRSGPEVAGHGVAGLFVGIGGPGGQVVGGPVDIRVLVLVEVGEAVDDRPRLLGGSGVVEPGDLATVDPLREDREVAADGGYVEDPLAAGGGALLGRAGQEVALLVLDGPGLGRKEVGQDGEQSLQGALPPDGRGLQARGRTGGRQRRGRFVEEVEVPVTRVPCRSHLRDGRRCRAGRNTGGVPGQLGEVTRDRSGALWRHARRLPHSRRRRRSERRVDRSDVRRGIRRVRNVGESLRRSRRGRG